MRSTLPLALCVALIGPTWADEPTEEAPTAQADESKGGDNDEGGSDLTEYIEVNDSFIPTSNTIATRLSVPLQLTPANIGVVSEPLLREQYAVDLGDSLNNVSGVNVQTGSGIFDYFTMRGFDALTSGTVMTDGVQEPEATTYQLYNAEGVEVLKGPGGYLYGPNPLSGAVNIIRKQPVPNTFANLTGTVGSFGTVRGTLDWNQKAMGGYGNFRLNGLWEQSDNYRDDKESTVRAINPGFALRLGDDSTLNFNLEYVRAEYGPDSGLPLYNGEIPEVPRQRSYQSPFDFSDQRLGRFQIDYENRVGDTLTLRNNTYYRGLDWETDGTIFNGVIPNQGTGDPEVFRTLTALDDRQQFFGNRFEVVMKLESGPITHELLVGLETAWHGDEYTLEVGALPEMDLFDPVENATERPPTVPIDFLDPTTPGAADARSVVIAPYVIDQMKLSKRFQILVGARFDSIDYEDSINDVSRDDSDVSPMLGVVYAPTTSLSLYANSGRSFAPASPRVSGDRKPEESRQVEIGVKKGFLGDRIRTTFALYRLDRENIAIPDDNGFSQQVGDQRSDGIEVEIAAEPIPRLRTFFTYAYTDAELTNFTEFTIIGFDQNGPIYGPVDRSGNTPAFVPKNLANLWISYGFRNRIGIGGGARYIGSQYIAEDNAFEIDSAVVLDALIYYDIKAWRLQLNVTNLADQEYEIRGFGAQSVIPADPIAAYASIHYRF
jgi:iron complex outermembrane receptor protein